MTRSTHGVYVTTDGAIDSVCRAGATPQSRDWGIVTCLECLRIARRNREGRRREALMIERATAVDRSQYVVGMEVIALEDHVQRDISRGEAFVIENIDWDLGAGPLFCRSQSDSQRAFFHPWEVEPAPTFDSIEDVERFLAG